LKDLKLEYTKYVRNRYVTIVIILLSIMYGGISLFLANSVTKADREPFEHTPEEYDLDYEAVTFQDSEGEITLRGWHIQANQEDPTIIFVHGLGSNRAGDEALDLASRLASKGYNSLLFDLRGHGMSDDKTISGGFFEQHDLIGAVDFLTGIGIPESNIAVIGFSMGAAAAILALSKEPNITALVVDSTYSDISDLITQEVSRKTALPDWLVPVFIPGTKLAADLIYKIKIVELVPRDAVTKIDYPILIIHGKSDDRIPVEHGIEVHQSAHHGSKLWIVPEVPHMDSFLRYPDEYTIEVLNYLDQRFDSQ
jgi:pimeloyl-ACP methyl ester carboxylesterase